MASPPSAQASNPPQALLLVVEQFNGRERSFGYSLNGAGQIKLGRSATGGASGPNDLVLEAPFVSRDQALIVTEGDGHRYIPIGGSNAFAIGGTPVLHQYVLRDGDVLRLYEPTSGGSVTITYCNSARRAESESAEIALSGVTTLSIGRLGTSIQLPHPTVSRRHAAITQRPDGRHMIADVGSANGTFVNGQRQHTATPHLLELQDVIRIGPFRLIYQGDCLARYDDRGAYQIDVRDMSMRVAGGRTILHDVSLSLAPREFVALVGGSGAGKSTLMKAICGFNRALSGNRSPVTVNGDDYYANFDAFRPQLGYVPQDDILHGNLGVREALGYTARLRLPETDAATITQRIDQALAAVDMAQPEHAEKPIEKLSGGQRKRVSIASELLADPSLFFLDEPTSGLDPGLDLKMMELLRRLAESGRTVVLVTHATENIRACHQVAFMADGHLVYFGPPDEALNFFGVEKFSQIYNRLSLESGTPEPWVAAQLGHELASWQAENPGKPDPRLSILWERKYRVSSQYKRFVTDRQARSHHTPPSALAAVTTTRRSSSSGLAQYTLLTRRYLSLLLRDRRYLLTLLLQSPIIALMLVLLSVADSFTGVTTVEGSIARVEAQNLAFLLVAISVWFGIINSAREITKENAIYRRERLSNLRIGPYLGSKLTGLALLALVQNLILIVIVGLRVEFPRFDPLLITTTWAAIFVVLMLVSLAGTALGLLISAFAKTADQAISIVPLALIPQILFAGLIFDLKTGSVAEFISWLMISRWGLDALGTSLNLNSLCQLPNVLYDGQVQPQCAVTDQLLSSPGGGGQLFDQFPFMRQGLEDASNFAHAFSYTAQHLMTVWGILVIFIGAGLGLTALLLKLRDMQR